MSAVIQDEYTGNGTKTNYNFTFPYLKTSDIKASLDAVVTTNFTLVNATTLQFNNGATPPVATAPADGVKIKIFRETGVDDLTATFYAGSAIKSEDLNDNFTQNLFSTQEVSQRYLSNLGGTMTGNIHLAKDVDITYEGDTENDFETRFTVVDPTADRTITFPNVTGTVVTTGDDGTVTSTMLTDNIALPGTFDVDGDTTLDNTTVDGVLDVNGSASIDNITFDGNQISTSTGNLTIDGTQGIHLRDSLTVFEPTSVQTLTIGGNLFLTSGSATIDDIYIDGNEIRSPNGDMIIDPVNDLYIEGTLNVKPNGTDARFSVDNTVITPVVNIIPSADDSIDLGSSTKQFKDLYIDGTGNIDHIVADTITGGAIVTSGTSTDDNKVYSAAYSDSRYFNVQTASDIFSGTSSWEASDTKVATTNAINARIIDLVDDVGGFVPIANEASFPTSNPDINDPATGGTIVSIAQLNANRTASAGSGSPNTGVLTTGFQTTAGTQVTINGCPNDQVFTAGFGILVETTSTLNTYIFHRYVPNATAVTTVAGSIGNVNTVAGSIGNVNTVGGSIANVNSVAGNATNINAVANNSGNVNNVGNQITNVANVGNSISQVNTVAASIANVNSVAADATDIGVVAGKATEIGRLGTADAVADLAILGTTDAVADMNTLGTSSNVTNMNTLAGISGNVTTVAGISSNVTTVANDGTDIGTVAGSIGNVNTAAGSIGNVNTVAGSIANVNTVAGNNTNVNTVAGISGNVTTVAGISGNVTTVAGNNSNVSTVAGSIGNVNTTAGSIANVITTAGSIANVNTVATNITNVNNASTYLNNFLALYLGTAASAPSTDTFGNALTEGDLYFNTGTKQLNIFNGSVFTNIVDTAIDFAKSATAAFNALYTASAGSNSIDLGGLAITGAAFANEAIATNRVSLTKGSATYNLGGI